MAKIVTPKGLRLILAVLFLGLSAVILVYRYGPAAQQQKNMALARPYAAKKMKEIAGRPEFAKITIAEYTGQNGSVIIFGLVETEADVAALHALIDNDPPPTSVCWGVQVFPEPEYWQKNGDEHVKEP